MNLASSIGMEPGIEVLAWRVHIGGTAFFNRGAPAEILIVWQVPGLAWGKKSEIGQDWSMQTSCHAALLLGSDAFLVELPITSYRSTGARMKSFVPYRPLCRLFRSSADSTAATPAAASKRSMCSVGKVTRSTYGRSLVATWSFRYRFADMVSPRSWPAS